MTTRNHPEPAPGPETSAGADLTPIRQAALSGEGSLLERVSSLIEQTRAAVATQANAALTLMHWHIGRMTDTEILCETRADYAKEIVASLEPQLTRRFGRGFTRANLYRMIQFSQVFSDEEIVVSLSRQLSWSHILALLPVRSPEARAYYIDQAVNARLSVRALRELIGRHGYERKEIANAQALGGSVIPAEWPSTGPRCRPRRNSKHASRRSTGMPGNGSPDVRSPRHPRIPMTEHTRPAGTTS